MDIVNENLRFLHEERLFDILKDQIVSSCRVNLTKDVVEEIYMNEYPDGFVQNEKSFEQINIDTAAAILSEEDLVKFRNTSSKEYLLNRFNEGITCTHFEFRAKYMNGRVGWVGKVAHLARQPETGDIYYFGYIIDRNIRKKRELAYPEKIELDEYTGLYKETTAQVMIDALLAEQKTGERFDAFVSIEIHKYSELKKKYGDVRSHMILSEMANALLLNPTKNFIATYCGNGRFSIYVSDMESVENRMKQFEDMLVALDLQYLFLPGEGKFEYFINVVLPEEEDDTYRKLDEKAKYLSRTEDPETREKCIVYKNRAIEYRSNSQSNFDFINILSDKGDQTSLMILNSTAALVAGETLSIAIDRVLQTIGEYYQADRVHIYEMSLDLENYHDTYIWRREGIVPIPDPTMDAKINKIPSFLRAFESRKTLILHNTGRDKIQNDAEYEFLSTYNIKALYLSPFHSKGRMSGFISVDNPTANLGNITLLNAMAYFIPSEIIKRRLQKEQDYSKYYDILTELENRNSYQKYVNSVTGENFSTLGVVSADINGLKDINMRFGSKYGDSYVCKVADLLRKYFVDCRLYRFSGGTFVVIATDMTQESFEDMVYNFKQVFNNEEEASISVGHGWSSSDIDIEKMVMHAEDMMLISKQNYYQKADESNKYFKYKLQQQLKQAIADNEFVVYLQPKAEIKTGKINGAEALIRRIHPQHGIITPNKFIPMLEKENLIRYIDFFVFEEVNKLLRRWIDEGRQVFVISLNFSRATLLEPDVMDTMERIYEKYQVPKSLIEIEITETLGDMEKATIEAIGGKIVKSGYRLSLDDFGASFSNLSILNTMQFDVLKLDKSIINNIVSADKSRIIIKKVLELCEELMIESIAEGVESEEQLEVLKAMGCMQAQGYLFNKPIPIKDFENKYLSI